MSHLLVLAQLTVLMAVLPVLDAWAPMHPSPLTRLSARMDRRRAGQQYAELDKGRQRSRTVLR
jgi:hypothetical protein